MKPYNTTIDTVKIQLDCNTQEEQHSVHSNLIAYISQHYYVNYKDFTNELSRQVNRVFFVYYNDTYIASLSTGIHTKKDRYNRPVSIYHISIKLAGLQRYNQAIDTASSDCLFRVCAFANSNELPFKITQLDVAIDIYAKFNNVLTVCTKRTANTQYFSLSEQQVFENTRYVEDVAYNRLHKVSKHAYTYDKAHKERLPYDLTRFELSLNPKFFSKNGADMDAITRALDRYHVMYFPTIQEKQAKINQYESFANFRVRDVKKIGFEAYRVYPDLMYINVFLYWMFNIELFHFEEEEMLAV